MISGCDVAPGSAAAAKILARIIGRPPCFRRWIQQEESKASARYPPASGPSRLEGPRQWLKTAAQQSAGQAFYHSGNRCQDAPCGTAAAGQPADHRSDGSQHAAGIEPGASARACTDTSSGQAAHYAGDRSKDAAAG